MNLFPDHFPLLNTDDELERYFLKYPNLAHDYLATATIRERRDHVESLWKKFEPYADSNFRKEFGHKVHKRVPKKTHLCLTTAIQV